MIFVLIFFMAFNSTKSRTWNDTELNDGRNFNTEFDRLYENDSFLKTYIENVTAGNNIIALQVNSGWQEIIAPVSADWSRIRFGNNTFVVVEENSDNVIYSTNNGQGWSIATAAEANQWRGLAFGGGQFVAVAVSGLNRTMYSNDNGQNWTAISAIDANAWESVAFGNDVFVAVSSDGTNRVMWTSDITGGWTAANAASASTWRAIEFGNDTFVAIAQGGETMYSTDDGQNWTAGASLPAGANWDTIEFGNGVFIAQGPSGSSRKAYSTDNGQTWTVLDSADAGGAASTDLAFGLDVFVSCQNGTGKSISKNDGQSFVQSTVPNESWVSVAFGNNTFIMIANTGGSSDAILRIKIEFLDL